MPGSHTLSMGCNALSCVLQYLSLLSITLSSKTQRPIRDVSSYSAALVLASTLLQGARFFDKEDGAFKEAFDTGTKAYSNSESPGKQFNTKVEGVDVEEGSSMMKYLIAFSTAMTTSSSLFALVILLSSTACCVYVLHTAFVRSFDKSIGLTAESSVAKTPKSDKGENSSDDKKASKKKKTKEAKKEATKTTTTLTKKASYPTLDLFLKGASFILAMSSNLFCKTPFEQTEQLGMVMTLYASFPQLLMINKTNDGKKTPLSKLILISAGLQFCGLLSLLNALCVEKVAYGPLAIFEFVKISFFYENNPLVIILSVVTVLRLLTVGFILFKHLLKHKEYVDERSLARSKATAVLCCAHGVEVSVTVVVC